MNERLYLFCLRKMEEKLKEFMTEEEYDKFSTEIANEGFKNEVENLPDGKFKNFIIDHFDEITMGNQNGRPN